MTSPNQITVSQLSRFIGTPCAPVIIETNPLLLLATIIRGAHTNRHDLAPESAGEGHDWPSSLNKPGP